MTRRHQWAHSVDDEAAPTRMVWRCKLCPVWREWDDRDGHRREVYHSATITRVIRRGPDGTLPPPIECAP